MNNPKLPWWKVPTMWLVIGGPLTVVVAAIATAIIAWHGADTVVSTPQQVETARMPAMQARNHKAAEQ